MSFDLLVAAGGINCRLTGLEGIELPIVFFSLVSLSIDWLADMFLVVLAMLLFGAKTLRDSGAFKAPVALFFPTYGIALF